MPRVNLQSSTDSVTILNPATSLMVFNTGTSLAPAGFYYNAGTPQAPQWALVLPNPANTSQRATACSSREIVARQRQRVRPTTA